MNSADTTITVSDILRAIAAAMQTPVIIILIFFIAFAVFLIGWVIAEGLLERRKLKVNISRLLDEIRAADVSRLPAIIEKSGLLKKQRAALIELTKHEDFTPIMREALAVNLIDAEKSKYDRIVKISDLTAKLAPIFGLLGTLIPLGPGIQALAQGDTGKLSESLLIAFDTTTAGLLSAAAAMVVSSIRKGWYSRYMRDLETVAEVILEMEKGEVYIPADNCHDAKENESINSTGSDKGGSTQGDVSDADSNGSTEKGKDKKVK